jgi:hypothetical protein
MAWRPRRVLTPVPATKQPQGALPAARGPGLRLRRSPLEAVDYGAHGLAGGVPGDAGYGAHRGVPSHGADGDGLAVVGVAGDAAGHVAHGPGRARAQQARAARHPALQRGPAHSVPVLDVDLFSFCQP